MNYKISLRRVSQVYFRVACQLLKAALTVLRCFCYTAWPSNESYRVLLFRRSTLYKLAVQSKPLSGFVRRMFLKQLKLAVYISKSTWKIAVLWEECVVFFCKWDRCMEKKTWFICFQTSQLSREFQESSAYWWSLPDAHKLDTISREREKTRTSWSLSLIK